MARSKAEMPVDPELRILEAKRNELFECIQTIYESSKKAHESEFDKEEFLSSVTNINELRSEFNTLLDKYNTVLLTTNPSAVPNFKPLRAFDELFCKIKRAAQLTTVPCKVEPAIPKARCPTLPPIEICSFDGDIRNWPLFFSTFKATIHDNPTLTNAEKLYYLVGKLSTKAQSVFSGITPCADNYEIILNALKSRYEDSRTLASTYLDQMLNFKMGGTASSSNFQLFMDKFVSAANGLRNLKLDDLSDFVFLHIALKKLDQETIRSFELDSRDVKIPTFNSLVDFIMSQCRIYQNSQPSSNHPRSNNKSKNPPNPQTYVTCTTPHKCLCSDIVHEHFYKCPEFDNLSPNDRYKCVKEHGGCINCLSLKHKILSCNSKLRCRVCKQRHHSKLHFNKNTTPNFSRQSSNGSSMRSPYRSDADVTSEVTSPPAPVAVHVRESAAPASHSHPAPAPPLLPRPVQCSRTDGAACSSNRDVSLCTTSTVALQSFATHKTLSNSQCIPCNTILLSTVQVIVYDVNGKQHVIRCLLDSASQTNFITSNCCNLLGWSCTKNSRVIVRGIGGAEKSVKGSIDFRIYSRFNLNIFYDITSLVVDRITDNLPTVPVDVDSLAHIRALPLADSAFATPGPIDVLLGASVFPHLLLPGAVYSLDNNLPPALQTVLGYIIMGSVPALPRPINNYNTTTCCVVVQDSLDTLLKKFWSLEEVSAPPAQSHDDTECENHFRATTVREESGRYVVALPFRDDVFSLGNSFANAHRRFLCLERKLEASTKLREAYDSVIREYIDK